MASYFDHRRHEARLRDLVALQDELLDPVMDVEKIRAEFVDSNLTGDRDLAERTSAEAERLGKYASRMEGLWALMIEASRVRDEALSQATAAELHATILTEHRRRTGAAPPRPRRRRASINLTYPASAARTILAKTDANYVAQLIHELGGTDSNGDENDHDPHDGVADAQP